MSRAFKRLDCPVCGQDVFGTTVVHVQGTRREVAVTGWCRQCGNGVCRTETYSAGMLVDAKTQVLGPKPLRRGRKAGTQGCSEVGCLWILAASALVSCFVLAVAWLLAQSGMLDGMPGVSP